MLSLICTQQDDIHSEYVKSAIEKLGGETLFFHRYDIEQYLSFGFTTKCSDGWLSIDGKKYSLTKDIASILWRNKPCLSSEILGAESNLPDQFRYHEWRHSLTSMEDFLPNKKCVNSLSSRTLMSRKVGQLKAALDCGLMIPSTIISNSRLDVESHLKDDNIIYKTLSSFATQQKIIYTNAVQKSALSADEICLAPGIFQERIEKAYELRVAVVGDDVFATKIDSQKYDITKLDWRFDQNEYMFSPGELSVETTNKLKKFHKDSGLVYGAYDFIVDKNNNEIFIECNPSGQWLFVGEELGEPITLALAKQLM